MTEHRLNALRGNNPLGFLAGLGALVVATRRESEDPRLAWASAPPHPARLWASTPSQESLVKAIFKELTERSHLTPEKVTRTPRFKDLTVPGCRKQFEK